MKQIEFCWMTEDSMALRAVAKETVAGSVRTELGTGAKDFQASGHFELSFH